MADISFSPVPSRGQRRGGLAGPKADINVTPFVDVMLVLLIVFMVSTPMMDRSLDVQVPQTSAAANAPSVDPQAPPVEIIMTATGDVSVGKQKTSLDQVVLTLKTVAPDPQTTIHIRADKNLTYAQVVSMMATLSQAGYGKLSLVVNTPS